MNREQRFSDTDTAVIRAARRRRREVIVLREDLPWLAEYSDRPKDMLQRMARRGALVEIGAGRYAIPKVGQPDVAYQAWQPLIHARLAPHGDYYVGFLTALIEHRLVDLNESAITAAIGFANSTLTDQPGQVGNRTLHVMHTDKAVFSPESGIELTDDPAYVRSDLQRTLVDALWSPRLFGSTETWATGWGRAASHDLIDAEKACRYAQILGGAVPRRVGAMLSMTGRELQARHHLPSRVRRADRTADLVADAAPADDAEIDPYWRVRFNVPRDRIEGWLLYGK
jgi:predicted transcriptional regulator of viral defense system